MHLRHFRITAVIGLVAMLVESGHLAAQAQQRPAAAPSADPFAGLQFRNIGPGIDGRPRRRPRGARIQPGGVLRRHRHRRPVEDHQHGHDLGGALRRPRRRRFDRRHRDCARRCQHWCGSAPAKTTIARAAPGATASTSRSTAARRGSTWGCATRSTSPASSSTRSITTSSTSPRSAASMGPGKERGVFKTTDGGLTWTNVLFVDAGHRRDRAGAGSVEQQGAVRRHLSAPPRDLGLQRRRPRQRDPQDRATPAARGRKLTNGIPSGPLGRIGMDVYRANPNIVYARIEHADRKRHLSLGRCRAELAEDVERQPAADVLQPDPHRSHQRPPHLRARRADSHLGRRREDVHRERGAALRSSRDVDQPGQPESHHRRQRRRRRHQLGQRQELGRDLQHGSRAVPTTSATTWRRPTTCAAACRTTTPGAGRARCAAATASSTTTGSRFRAATASRRVIDPNDPRHDLRRIAGRQHRPRRSAHQRAQDDPAAARIAASRLCAGTGTRRFTSRRTARRRSTSARTRCSSRPTAARRGTPISADLTQNADRETLSLMGVDGQGVHDRQARRRAVVRQPRAARRIAEAGGRALRRRRRRRGPHDARTAARRGRTSTSRFPNMPKNAYVSGLVASAHDANTVYVAFDNHIQRRLQQLRVRERRRRQQLPFDQRGHCRRARS